MDDSRNSGIGSLSHEPEPEPQAITPKSRKRITKSPRLRSSSRMTASLGPEILGSNRASSNRRSVAANTSSPQYAVPDDRNSHRQRSHNKTTSQTSTPTTPQRSSFISRCASLFHSPSSHAKTQTTQPRATSMPLPTPKNPVYTRSPVSDKPLPALPIYKHMTFQHSTTFLNPRPAPFPPMPNKQPTKSRSASNPERGVTTCWAAVDYKPWWETPSRGAKSYVDRRASEAEKNIDSERIKENEMEIDSAYAMDSELLREPTNITTTTPQSKSHDATRRYGVQYPYSHPSLKNLRRSINIHESMIENQNDVTGSAPDTKPQSPSESDSDSNYDRNEEEEDTASTDEDFSPITPLQSRAQSRHVSNEVAVHRDSIVDYGDILDLYLIPKSTSVFRNEHVLSLDTPIRSPLGQLKDDAKQVRFQVGAVEEQDRKIGVTEIENKGKGELDKINSLNSLSRNAIVLSGEKPSLKELKREGREKQRRTKRIQRIMTVLRNDTD